MIDLPIIIPLGMIMQWLISSFIQIVIVALGVWWGSHLWGKHG